MRSKLPVTITVVLIGLAAGVVAAVLYGAPAAMQAYASRRLPEGVWWRVLSAALRDRLMLSVLLFYLLGAVANYVAIQTLPLYLAQAVTSASLIFTALASAWWLSEWPFAHQWIALVGVIAGLVLLAMGAGKAGGDPTASHLLTWLYLGVLGCAALGEACRRWLHGHAGGVVLGLVAGVAFAGLPLGTRLLHAPYWRLQSLAAIGVIALYGCLGFLYSSISLTRVQVNTATAPLILSQTAIPAALGIWLYGDQVRPGWGWIILLGLVVSMVSTLGVAAVAQPIAEKAAEKMDQ